VKRLLARWPQLVPRPFERQVRRPSSPVLRRAERAKQAARDADFVASTRCLVEEGAGPVPLLALTVRQPPTAQEIGGLE